MGEHGPDATSISFGVPTLAPEEACDFFMRAPECSSPVLYILPLSLEAIYLTPVAYVVLLGEYQLAARQQTKNVLASPSLI